MQVSQLYDLFCKSTGISTDTRSVEQGNIFFALKGERFNGNLYAENALKGGAAYVVIDEKYFDENERFILVEDVLKTLQQLANFHRKQLQTIIIAIGGSNGKTTTKELISAVLQSTFKTFATKGNLNNHIGVPLSLLSIKDSAKPLSGFSTTDRVSPVEPTDFAIIELGANHLGETKFLCEIAEPDFGLITNNGKDHLEGYGSIEGVIKGNGELFDYLRKENRIAFVNADQQDLMLLSEGIKRTTYGENEISDYKGSINQQFPFLQLTTGNSQLTTNLIGKYNFPNIMAAVCIGKYFGVDEEKVKQAIESYSPINNRSQVLKIGSNTFILDAYNSNPSSLNAALDNFFDLPEENKIVIAGDMAELGAASLEEHIEILKKIEKACLPDRQGNWKMVLLVGEEFKKADIGNKFLHFKNVIELKEWFGKQSFENYFFLLKASRVIGLEKLIQ